MNDSAGHPIPADVVDNKRETSEPHDAWHGRAARFRARPDGRRAARVPSRARTGRGIVQQGANPAAANYPASPEGRAEVKR